MKKKSVFLAAAIFLLTLSACEKKDDNTPEPDFRTVGVTTEIAISDITGSYPPISEVAFVARFHMPSRVPPVSGMDADSRVMLSGPFNSKITRFLLPVNPPQELLRSIADDIPKGFTISDPEAQTISFVEIACNMGSSGKVTSALSLRGTYADTSYTLQYIYCDRSTTVSGTGADWWGHSTTYDLHLEKGWNQVVEKSVWAGDQRFQTVTHQMPSGMRWMYVIWL